VLAASACRTSITEIYQSGSASNPPGVNGWGCEAGAGTSSPSTTTKYVAAVTTNADGAIKVTAQGFNDADIDAKSVTLVPMVNATTAATFTTNVGQPLFGWRCGLPADGTDIKNKFLPGSCRG
jgi:type IV pilus assembly protein PilA